MLIAGARARMLLGIVIGLVCAAFGRTIFAPMREGGGRVRAWGNMPCCRA